MSTKRTEESFKFIQIKGESPPEPYPCGISLEVSQDTAFSLNSQPHFALFLSPLAELLGRYNLPELPTTYCTLEHVSIFSSKVQKFGLRSADPPEIQTVWVLQYTLCGPISPIILKFRSSICLVKLFGFVSVTNLFRLMFID